MMSNEHLLAIAGTLETIDASGALSPAIARRLSPLSPFDSFL